MNMTMTASEVSAQGEILRGRWRFYHNEHDELVAEYLDAVDVIAIHVMNLGCSARDMVQCDAHSLGKFILMATIGLVRSGDWSYL